MLTLSNGQVLRGDVVLKHITRSDLTPVPVTLECSLRIDPELEPYIQEGETVKSGRYDNEFIIAEQWRNTEVQDVQGSRPYGSFSFIALLKQCHKIAMPMTTSRAVIKRGSTFGDVYKSCGATARIESDLNIIEFGCSSGDIPSFGIARLLQEEAASVVWTGNALRFLRNADLFKQEPAQKMHADASNDVSSELVEQMSVPYFISTNEDGDFIAGDIDGNDGRHVSFVTRMDQRRLNNMKKVLINKKVLRSAYAAQINAGSLIEIAGKNYVVITAAHVQQDTGNTGVSANAYSKFWLGVSKELA